VALPAFSGNAPGAETPVASYRCVVVQKQHSSKEEAGLADGPNDVPPGVPGTVFRVDRKSRRIQGFDSPLGRFSEATQIIAVPHESQLRTIYYAPEVHGETPVLHLEIDIAAAAPTKAMTLLLGRLVFNGYCD
jgi:hypothetical protein